MSRARKLSSERHPAIPRRTFLRGAGVTLGLPWLRSLWEINGGLAAARAAEATGAPLFPNRFAVLFMGNGISPKNWSAKGEGTDLELGKSLQPLEPLKAKINVIDGLFHKSATGQGIHPAQTGNLLTGVPFQKGAIIHSGVSMDQLLASRIGQDTAEASLVLACEQPMTGFHETNFSNVYSSHISWQNADSPVPNEIYPSLAFDSLFENGGSQRNLSILDRVKDRANELSRKISSADKAKLDEYLQSVRNVESRIERTRVVKRKAEDRADDKGKPLFTMERPANGLPEDLRDHMWLMCDIIALAFQTDRTRIASLILARDLSKQYYPFLDVSTAHHGASHQDNSDGYERIVRFNIGQFAYLADKLNQMPEGEGTVLDNSCLMFLSNMYSGTAHDNKKVPVITAGSLGGSLKTGRALDYFPAGDDNRKLCSLYLGLMDRMGVKLDHFGDADSRLEGF